MLSITTCAATILCEKLYYVICNTNKQGRVGQTHQNPNLPLTGAVPHLNLTHCHPWPYPLPEFRGVGVWSDSDCAPTRSEFLLWQPRVVSISRWVIMRRVIFEYFPIPYAIWRKSKKVGYYYDPLSNKDDNNILDGTLDGIELQASTYPSQLVSHKNYHIFLQIFLK